MTELFSKGGVLMWPLLACSILAVAVVIEKMMRLRKNKIMPEFFLQEVEALVEKRKIADAQALCRQNSSSLAHIVLRALDSFGLGRDVIKDRIEESGKKVVAQLEKGCNILGTVVSISPLLGLLGTVFGMIKVFQVLSSRGVGGDASGLAGGIAEALITTAAGLSIAIPTLVAYRYFTGKIEKIVLTMEEQTLKILDKLEKLS
ncbi:MAG: MotA/TolQ/ExbB proton channel family protein [Deltaproteobacteria bacterium]|nr:MotA/TolQ/ExbB proton channel family protein [Deltaproteobacteria bacterium]